MVLDRSSYPPRCKPSSSVGAISRPIPSTPKPSSTYGIGSRSMAPQTQLRKSEPVWHDSTARGPPVPSTASKPPQGRGSVVPTTYRTPVPPPPTYRTPVTPPPRNWNTPAPPAKTRAPALAQTSKMRAHMPSSKAWSQSPTSNAWPKVQATAISAKAIDTTAAPMTPPLEEDEEEHEPDVLEETAAEDDEFPEEWNDIDSGAACPEEEYVHTPIDEDDAEEEGGEMEDQSFDEQAIDAREEEVTGELDCQEQLPFEDEELQEDGDGDGDESKWDLHESPWDHLNPVGDLEDVPPPAYEEPEEDDEEAQAEDSMRREEDLPLDEVPQHLRDAVEGSLKMKKILEGDGDGQPAKRRRLEDADCEDADSMKRESHPEKTKLLREMRVEGDRVCRYVVEGAELEEVDAFRKSNFFIRSKDKKTAAEQMNDQFIRLRERNCPHGSKLDPVSAFVYRFKLKEEDDRMLRELSHKDLRYVIRLYAGDCPLRDLITEAKASGADKGARAAASARPGALTLGRFNRLELIDAQANALVVGDANLTFSLLLAQHRRDLGHSGQTVATTFEQLPTLRERYKEIDETIKHLFDLGAEVLHNVDCTRLGVDTRFIDKEAKFGAVYYNFPHAGAVKGYFDGHPFVRWRHENLMHLFFSALRAFVKKGGSVKISSNRGAQGVRFSDIMFAATKNEFVHVETVPIAEWTLRNYNRSYGDKRDETKRLKDGQVYNDQRGHADMVYCFTYAPTGGAVPKPQVRYPPTKDDLVNSTEGALQNLHGDRKWTKVEELCALFLSYVQGIHVG